MMSTNSMENNINNLKKNIKYFSDFPKPGILYKDVLSVLDVADGVNLLEKIMTEIALHQLIGKIDCIAMLETRGYLIGPMIALRLNIPCIPIAKKGNLPGSTTSISYVLEYGEDTLELQLNSVKKGQRVLLVDDFLATGGTLEGASNLVKKCGGNVVQGLVLMEKLELGGRKRLDFPIISLISE